MPTFMYRSLQDDDKILVFTVDRARVSPRAPSPARNNPRCRAINSQQRANGSTGKSDLRWQSRATSC